MTTYHGHWIPGVNAGGRGVTPDEGRDIVNRFQPQVESLVELYQSLLRFTMFSVK